MLKVVLFPFGRPGYEGWGIAVAPRELERGVRRSEMVVSDGWIFDGLSVAR